MTEKLKKDIVPATLEEALLLVNELREENENLHHSLDKLRRELFGSKSEKLRNIDKSDISDLDGIQQDLFDAEVMNKVVPAVATKDKITYERIKPQRDGHGRRVSPDDIRREEIIIDLTEEEKTCDCGCAKKRIGEEVSEELDFVPAHLFVKRIVRPSYACPKCSEKGVQTALPPSRIIPKSLGSSALYAHITTSKFRWHLPLYRQEKIFDHFGVPINRSVMCGWEKQLLPCLESIYFEMKKDLLASTYIQTDETTISVLDKEKQGKVHKGYLWPYTDGKQILFEYQSGRGRAGPLKFLEGFEGYLQSDGYAAYESITNKELRDTVKHFVCWAHARREIYEVRNSAPEYLMPILLLIGRLYVLERRIKRWGIPVEKISQLRKQIAPRYLDKLKARLDACPDIHTPKSPVRKAVNYLLNRWNKLRTYLEFGWLQIDNNRIENAIRPIALGRKNWLFAGNEDGAYKLAIIYSIINTCLMLKIDPEVYLTDLFNRYMDHPANRLYELTPAGWLAAREV